MPVNQQSKMTYCEVAGTLRLIDALARELTLCANGAEIRFDVPVDCQIQLNGERVKLRLLQPLDHAQIFFEECKGSRLARSIRVNWLWAAGSGRLDGANGAGLSDGKGRSNG